MTKSKAQREREERERVERYEEAIARVLADAPPIERYAATLGPILEATNFPFAAVAVAEPVEPPEPSPPRLGDVRVVAPSRASGSATGTAGSTATSFRRGSRDATRTSGVAVAAPATTRNENGRTADVSGVDGTAAPTSAAS